ncbi:carbohydrate ABC transporter permease [Paenibacillus sp. GCM10012307]|uniref:Carbohydrate ABC transporter permease n=1 Tax=Paenibacillus roseus TaxID=2798579 RepID=A0A934J406_9BACL|nr:carbohydrate ABC transporter permease [Paenibacillus roseus]MBJ6362864.1 carbohydrate ABC transporter permease [Paenibacillus roseus]
MRRNYISLKGGWDIKMIGLNIVLVIGMLTCLYPLIWLVLFSLKDNNEIFGGNIAGLPTQFLWENYKEALIQAKVGVYFTNSVFVTAITIAATCFLSLTSSYAIIRMRWKLSKVTLNLLLLGLMVPQHAALLPLFIILKKLSILDSYWALIIPYTLFAIPMGVFIFSGFMKGIPRELEEAACIDGCNIYQILFQIVLPLVAPALATIAIFTYLSSWNELMFAVTFINSSSLKTITVGIQTMVGQYSTSWGPIGAGLVVTTLPTILIYTFLSGQVQKSLIVGAVKG